MLEYSQLTGGLVIGLMGYSIPFILNYYVLRPGPRRPGQNLMIMTRELLVMCINNQALFIKHISSYSHLQNIIVVHNQTSTVCFDTHFRMMLNCLITQGLWNIGKFATSWLQQQKVSFFFFIKLSSNRDLYTPQSPCQYLRIHLFLERLLLFMS